VYRSRFSTLRGVPVAIFGAFAFVVAQLMTLAGTLARSSVRENVPGYLFVLSTLALAVVMYFGYVSFFVLKAVCLLCLITYAAVVGLFLVSGAAVSFPMTTLPKRAAQDARVFLGSPLAIAVTVLFLASAASTLAFFPRAGAAGPPAASQASLQAAPPAAPSQDQRSDFERWFISQPRVPLVVPREGAKVLVVKFNDYQCPPCRDSYLAYKSIFAKYEAEQPGAVRLVVKDYPLNSECNPQVPNPGPHQAACGAAVAVRLSREHNRAELMEEWLYNNGASLTPPAVRQAAHDVGQVSDFDARYAATLELVRGDVALGQQVGVGSTPTFFVNGVKVVGVLPAQYFDQAIAYELQHAPSR